jgi:hypothetical protein
MPRQPPVGFQLGEDVQAGRRAGDRLTLTVSGAAEPQR